MSRKPPYTGSGTITAAQTSDILAGNSYVNVRSQVFSSGEIRGQLFTVPEPASLSMLALAGLLTLRRRSR